METVSPGPQELRKFAEQNSRELGVEPVLVAISAGILARALGGAGDDVWLVRVSFLTWVGLSFVTAFGGGWLGRAAKKNPPLDPARLRDAALRVGCIVGLAAVFQMVSLTVLVSRLSRSAVPDAPTAIAVTFLLMVFHGWKLWEAISLRRRADEMVG